MAMTSYYTTKIQHLAPPLTRDLQLEVQKMFTGKPLPSLPLARITSIMRYTRNMHGIGVFPFRQYIIYPRAGPNERPKAFMNATKTERKIKIQPRKS